MIDCHDDLDYIKQAVHNAQILTKINTQDPDELAILRMKIILHLTRVRKLTSALIIKISEETDANSK